MSVSALLTRLKYEVKWHFRLFMGVVLLYTFFKQKKSSGVIAGK